MYVMKEVLNFIPRLLTWPRVAKQILIPLFLCTALFYPLISYANISLMVPFTPQAPFGNWAQPWQDFCEEASVVMAAHFVLNIPLTAKMAAEEMQIIRQYEELVFGSYKDTSVEHTASVLKDLYGFSFVRTRDIKGVEDIKHELRASNLVIVPVAGRMLRNPYFIPPGPRYHMLVIRGFDDEKKVFITNDPGTRRGNGLVYREELLFEAIHDLVDGSIAQGEKRMIVVGKK